MSTTTQILFNSPALHSLKREQLVKLCKIHSLKASGKNKELIHRLKRHAKTLPSDDPLSIAIRCENPDAKHATDSEDETSSHSTEVDTPTININRPSEQWEVVMDTITEVDEETLRSNRGASDRQVGEFGTNTSKGSVTSSLKAIANSLGLKRNTSKSNGTTSSSSSLSSKEVFQTSSTLPTSDPNGGSEEPPVEPVPGQSNLQGFPAPTSGRLSFSQAPTSTTIRLVSNLPTNPELLLSPPKLKPFATLFDLVPGTPEGTENSSIPVWPLSPGGAGRESLYPSVPTFEEFGDLIKQQSTRLGQYDTSDMDIDMDMPGGLVAPSMADTIAVRFNTGATPKSTEKPSAVPVDIFSPATKPPRASTHSRPGIPRSEPFVFGSPLTQHSMSNLQFRTAAQSVLDEMNKRLADEGVESVDVNVLTNRRTSTEESTSKQASNVPPRVGDMFDKIHQKGFDKMDSITSHYAAKRGARNSSSQPILSKKRKSSLVVKERQPGVLAARHRPNGSRVASGASVRTLPGAFGEDGDEDSDVADRRSSKRPRVEREESDSPAGLEKASLPVPPDAEEETRELKEREVIRRRLERNKAKRRSSMGRPSLGRAPPQKPARFGFLASAKSLVQNVWNRGAGSKAPSNIPVTRSAHAKGDKTLPKTMEKKTAVIAGSSGVPPLGSQTKSGPSGGSINSLRPNAPGRSMLAPPLLSGEGGKAATSSRIWKSPTPSYNPPSSSTATNPRSSTIAGYGQSNNKDGSLIGFSSLGTKSSLSANASRTSSMGAKPNTRTSAGSQKLTMTIPRSRTTSTLMAPTASSLAKMHSRIPAPATSHDENATLDKAGTSLKQRAGTSPLASAALTLEQITNSPQGPTHTRPTKIFGQPLSPVPIPAPPLPMSLTAAATRIATAPVLGDGHGGKGTPRRPLKGTPKAKVLPGRRPRISRSKVIARLASQRAAADSGVSPATSSRASASASASAGLRTGRTGGKIRSSMGAEVAGKTRRSYAGTKGSDMLMSAKKWVRQSEQARRRSRVHASRMDVD